MTIKIEQDEVKIKVGDKLQTIGKLHGKVLHVKRDRSKHLMRKFGAYGFAKVLLEQPFFDYLMVIETTEGVTNNYLIERELALSEGRVFQAPDFEKQVFVTLQMLNQYNIDKKPRK
jgi:hypothetical protein